MPDTSLSFLSRLHPYDVMPEPVRADIAEHALRISVAKGDVVYRCGDVLKGLFIIAEGKVSVTDANGTQVSLLERENSFGERGLLRDGLAATTATALDDARLICIPATLFRRLLQEQEDFAAFFERAGSEHRGSAARPSGLDALSANSLMSAPPVTCAPNMPIVAAAQRMRDKRISCLCVVDQNNLVGIVTLRDLSGKALAEGMPHETPISAVMTPDPRVLPPSALGSDILHLMMEHSIGHLPIVSLGELVGVITQSDLTRFQASNAAGFISGAARSETAQQLCDITMHIPKLLVQLVAAGNRHDIVTRMITDIADVVTRRLLRLAERKFGPAPARYLWLACGSQGRQEQTGVSDQDNCLILEDGLDDAARDYFVPFAQFVSDGLHACGYVYCPGDMMATNPRWCQPLSVWRDYFQSWIAQPSKEAQMLASVMFDLRPIGGDFSLFEGLHAETVHAAASNSIFTAHMASNAVTHPTPLGFLRNVVTIRSGEHRHTLDTKLNGVVPVVDLGRMYALQAQLEVVNTRARLEGALDRGIISQSGGRDLLDAYDLVAQTRLEHQARRIKQGKTPDNYLNPATLSGFERSHLRDAFVVIKTMQSALMQGRGLLS